MEKHAALLPSPGTGGRHTPFWLREMHCARADEPSGWAWAGAGRLRQLAALLLTVWLSRAPAGLVSWCRGWRSGGDPVLPQKRAHFGRRVWPAGRAFRRPRRCGHRRMRVREPCGKARQDRTHRGAERVGGSAVSASAWGAAAGSSRLARAFLSKGVRGAVSSAGPPCTPRPTKCFGRAER